MTTEAEVYEELRLRVVVDELGTRCYYNSSGQLHRNHGPALVCGNMLKMWFQNGVRHRVDGPAVIWPDGSLFWYQNGILHREDGPAIERPNGVKEWYLNGKRYTQQEYYTQLKTLEHTV
jgi:hypothetical protein